MDNRQLVMIRPTYPKRFVHPWVDDRQAPLYQMNYPETLDEADVVARNGEIFAWYRQLDHEIGWVVDCTRMIQATARLRKLQAEHVKRIQPFAARWDVCDAFVIRSGLVRGYLTAVFWLAPPPYEYETFATIEPATQWVKGKLAARTLEANRRNFGR